MDNKANILELISEVERQMNLRNIKCLNNPDWKLVQLPHNHRTAKYKLAQCNAKDGAIYHILINECYYDGHSLQLELITQEESSRKVIDNYYERPAKLIEPNNENAYFWTATVPIVIERLLRDVLIYFYREDIANTELTIERSWTLKELEVRFNEAYEADLWIYEGNKRICHDPRRIEEFGSVIGDTLRVRGIDQVGDIVKRMHDILGLTVRIRDRRFGQQPPDNTPLYDVHGITRPHHPDIKKRRTSCRFTQIE